MRRWLRYIIVGACAIALLSATGTWAKDSHAPAGAGERWLPCEPWVMYHWLPFDAGRLYKLTGTTRDQWRDFIRDDKRHNLAQFIAGKGQDPEVVASRLMSRWQGRVSARRYAELDRRTHELLTQGHLAQHVFFHFFHHPALALRARWIFNVSPEQYHEARMAGFTPREIARHGRVPVARAVRRAFVVLRQSQDEAVKSGQTSRVQAGAFLRLERSWVSRWLNQSVRPRGKSFPTGHRVIEGTRDQRACVHMVGRGHIPGAHEPTPATGGH